jgi:hypothetical protein
MWAVQQLKRRAGTVSCVTATALADSKKEPRTVQSLTNKIITNLAEVEKAVSL